MNTTLVKCSYLMKSLTSTGEREDIAILNMNCLIVLFKEVYHHDFEQKMKDAASEFSVKLDDQELLKRAPKKREEFGIISKTVLKHLWKCKEELFVMIIELFQKFNLTYPVQIESQTFYFFPYLKKSAFKDKIFPQQCTVTLRFIFTYFFPQFFLQRLALEFWRTEDNMGTKMVS